MSIPKVIHYCWFGHGNKSELMLKCMESWKKYCPDYEIVEWNEDNFDVNFCPYAARAFRQKRYGFLSDAARIKIIYENGGIYLDTDAELKKNLDDLLDHDAWFAYGTVTQINTGSGFGAIKGHPFLAVMYKHYTGLGSKEPYRLCTENDTAVFSSTFESFAADHDVAQTFEYEGKKIIVINDIWRYVIHHYTNTWLTPVQRIYNSLNKATKGALSRLKNDLIKLFTVT